MPREEMEVDITHNGTYVCTECGIDVRVGRIDNQNGLYCGCTVSNGRPFKGLAYGMLPWPDRWELEKNDD